MSLALNRRRPNVGRLLAVSFAAALALTIGIVAANFDAFAGVAAQARGIHPPDLALLAAQPVAVQAHVLAALAAVALGAVQMLRPKGRLIHRIAGWTWVGLMAVVVGTSFFVFGLNGDRFSFLHIFSVWWIVFLSLAVLAAKRHRVGTHRAIMMVLFYGSLLLTGVFAFLPGRLMWTLFFG
jgi:uncharacterized membrane protein